jgi:hypothetical protein
MIRQNRPLAFPDEIAEIYLQDERVYAASAAPICARTVASSAWRAAESCAVIIGAQEVSREANTVSNH